MMILPTPILLFVMSRCHLFIDRYKHVEMIQICVNETGICMHIYE